MTPEMKLLEELQRRVTALERVENVPFIKNLIRRIDLGIESGDQASAATISQAVRNSADTGSVTVCKVPDGKLEITLEDGTIKYIGFYNS